METAKTIHHQTKVSVPQKFLDLHKQVPEKAYVPSMLKENKKKRVIELLKKIYNVDNNEIVTFFRNRCQRLIFAILVEKNVRLIPQPHTAPS